MVRKHVIARVRVRYHLFGLSTTRVRARVEFT